MTYTNGKSDLGFEARKRAIADRVDMMRNDSDARQEYGATVISARDTLGANGELCAYALSLLAELRAWEASK